MLPKPPPRLGQLGFLYHPPLRIQGISVAGECTAVMVPEYDVCFDIGVCHRPMLSARYVALTHGHMDHVAGLPYYFSQRWFQGMGTGVCICDRRIEDAVRNMIAGWADLEQQRTSHEIISLGDGDEYEIKSNVFLRAFHVDHTVPAMGYGIVERRTKLRPEFTDLPQERLRQLKLEGIEITRELRVPIMAFVADTLPGPHLFRDEVLKAKIVLIECTFFESDHKSRAIIGKHIHVDDIAEFIPHLEAEVVILTHISRRTNLGHARKELILRVGEEQAERVIFLMDHRENRKRYEQQLAQANLDARASGAEPTTTTMEQ